MWRGLLLENLGIKLVALLLAIVVYLHVYTERTASMTVVFPVEFTDVPESLAVVVDPPPTVVAVMRGTGKELIRLRLREPRVRVSLAGAQVGPLQRAVTSNDLPLAPSDHVAVEQLLSPRMIQVELERLLVRDVPVAARISGRPPAEGWAGGWAAEPARVVLRGPRRLVQAVDSLALSPVRHDAGGAWQTIVAIDSLPLGCVVDPPRVELKLAPRR